MFILCVIIIIAVICIAIIRYHSDKEVDEVNKYIDWIEKTYHFEANFRLLRKEYPHLKLLPIEPLDIRRLNTYDPQRNEIYYDSRARRATRRPDQEQPAFNAYLAVIRSLLG